MDSGVEVVDLRREVYEVILTSVEVKSHESEGAFVNRSVSTYVHAVHEAHVGVEEQRFSGAIGIGRSTGALDVGHAYIAIEIVDRRRIDAGTEGDRRKVTPPITVVLGVGTGAMFDGFAACASAGIRPTPAAAPVTAAIEPMNALRVRACLTACRR